ncbi:MAG TPA: DUF3046 domain-containing protein [Mycobacteriales bacterium]|nr:DUF3046 domain-containing protein [Mycobacteriales bacterium]
MRVTEFWERMREQFGPAYADAVARDQVIRSLGERNAVDALAAGIDPKQVWLAVCEHFELPIGVRH